MQRCGALGSKRPCALLGGSDRARSEVNALDYIREAFEERRCRALARSVKAHARRWQAFWRDASRATVWSWKVAAPPFVPKDGHQQQRSGEEFIWNVHAPIFVPGGGRAAASHAPAVQPGAIFGDSVGDFLKEGGGGQTVSDEGGAGHTAAILASAGCRSFSASLLWPTRLRWAGSGPGVL